MIPKNASEPVLGRGRLKSVWLGGLACPGAVVASLKHEKAAMTGCNVSEVRHVILAKHPAGCSSRILI